MPKEAGLHIESGVFSYATPDQAIRMRSGCMRSAPLAQANRWCESLKALLEDNGNNRGCDPTGCLQEQMQGSFAA